MLPDRQGIVIKTSAGISLGMGHIQRMYSLLWYLNEIKNIKTFLVSDVFPDPSPSELKQYFKANLDFSPVMIIRDMRDSSEDEISNLKKTAPVTVIDDNGPGRHNADHAIDILPNPIHENAKFDSSIFLYGYNFLSALRTLKNKIMIKKLDFTIYPGNPANSKYIDFLISLLPHNATYAVLNSKENSNIKELSYAEIILASKAVISHFGITLYEAFISGCRTVSINPTEYHSKLSDMAKDYLHLTNLGVSSNINISEAKASISKILKTPVCSEINAADVYAKAINGLEDFCRLLKV